MRATANSRNDVVSRLFDCICAAVGLLLLSPLLVCLSLLIAVVDGAPVFFRQTRVGRNGRPFRILKFRSMRASPGRLITCGGDQRITRLGGMLRNYKLDEFPQLWNVLRGEMGLVGPRPEVPEYARPESRLWQAVLVARPGITDLASLLYRNEEELLRSKPDPEAYYRDYLQPRKLALNLTYLSTRNLWLDLRLIVSSIRYSLFPKSFDPESVYTTFVPGGPCERHVYPLSYSLDR